MASQHTSKEFLGGAGVAIAALAAWHAHALDYRGDDLFITLRYVTNLISGRGLVYNVGERVEGYSNFLWVLMLAGPARLGVDLVVLARGLGVLFAGLNTFLAYLIALRLEATRARAVVAPLLLALATPFATWAGSGLEAPLFSALISCALLERFRERPRLPVVGLLLGLAAITRPEGILFAFTFAFHEATGMFGRAGSASSSPSAPARLAAAGRVLGAAGLLWVPQLLFRRWYYAQWLPNTYYAKVDHDGHALQRGVGYLGAYLDFASWLPLTCAACCLVLAWRDARVRHLGLALLAYLAWVAAAGGDGLTMFRFVAHVMPLICILVARGASVTVDALAHAVVSSGGARLPPFTRHVNGALLSPLLVIALSWPSALLLLRPEWPWWKNVNGFTFPDVGRHWLFFDQYFAERVARAGRFLNEHAAADELIAANPAGIGYYTRQPVLDLLGLTDPTIARSPARAAGFRRAGHARANSAYVLGRKPAYVLLGNVALLPTPLTEEELQQRLYLPSEQGLWLMPEFRRDYERVVVELAPTGAFRFFTFYRRRDARYQGPS